LQRRLPENAVYWLNATDPASVCGLPLPAFRGQLPRRVAGNHVVYRGSEVAVVSQRNGRSLTFAIGDDDPDLAACLGFLHHLMNRQFQPLRRITIETINGEEAAASSYLDGLRTVFDAMVDYKNVILYRRPT
jgi:ATP-dependent Lhr-like helicase